MCDYYYCRADPSGRADYSVRFAAGRLPAGITASNPAGGMHICLLCVLCVVRKRSLRRVDYSYRGILPSVVCLRVIVKNRQWGGLGPLGAVEPWKYIYIYIMFYFIFEELTSSVDTFAKFNFKVPHCLYVHNFWLPNNILFAVCRCCCYLSPDQVSRDRHVVTLQPTEIIIKKQHISQLYIAIYVYFSGL